MDNKSAAALLKLLAVLALIPTSIFLNGYTLSVLWGWFIVPIFGLPTLGIVSAMGFALVVTYLTHQADWTKDENKTSGAVGRAFTVAVLKPLFGLLFGWVLLQFL